MKTIFVLVLVWLFSAASYAQYHRLWPLHSMEWTADYTHFLPQQTVSLCQVSILGKENQSGLSSLSTVRLSQDAGYRNWLLRNDYPSSFASPSPSGKKTAGAVLIGVGVPITLLGLAAAIGYGIDGETAPLIIMCIATPVGVGLLTGGIVLAVSGKREGSGSTGPGKSYDGMVSKPSAVTIDCGLTRTMPGVGVSVHF